MCKTVLSFLLDSYFSNVSLMNCWSVVASTLFSRNPVVFIAWFLIVQWFLGMYVSCYSRITVPRFAYPSTTWIFEFYFEWSLGMFWIKLSQIFVYKSLDIRDKSSGKSEGANVRVLMWMESWPCLQLGELGMELILHLHPNLPGNLLYSVPPRPPLDEQFIFSCNSRKEI